MFWVAGKYVRGKKRHVRIGVLALFQAGWFRKTFESECNDNNTQLDLLSLKCTGWRLRKNPKYLREEDETWIPNPMEFRSNGWSLHWLWFSSWSPFRSPFKEKQWNFDQNPDGRRGKKLENVWNQTLLKTHEYQTDVCRAFSHPYTELIWTLRSWVEQKLSGAGLGFSKKGLKMMDGFIWSEMDSSGLAVASHWRPDRGSLLLFQNMQHYNKQEK